MKVKILISYSRDDMDSWEEGTKTHFYLETPNLVDRGTLTGMGKAFLELSGIEYRECMVRIESIY